MEIMALAVARGLRTLGHEVEVCVSGWNDGDFISRLENAGLRFHILYLGKISVSPRPRALLYTLDALLHLRGARRVLREHLRSFRPDVVVVCNRDWAIQSRSLLRKHRTIFHVHELAANTLLTKKIFGGLNTWVTAFVAPSTYIGDRLRRMGVAPEKTHVVYNGIEAVDNGSFSVSRTGVPTIGIVGQVGPWKGHDDLVEALAILRKKTHVLRCVVFGDGEEVYQAGLKEKASLLGVADCLTWRGYVQSPQEIYDEIDICVVPSRQDEAFGLVAAEAALRAIPVVAARRGALPEIVVDGETGFLVDAERPDQLADRLQLLIQDRDLRQRLGAAGHARARTLFTASRMVAKIEALCASIVKE
jgi:glycosyltransferase involved in cell wall biosynthesis